MYNLKGFYEYLSLVNNTKDQVAVLGEISANSLTYAKDITVHTGASQPNTTFLSFHSVSDNNPIEVPVNYSTATLKVGEYLYTQAKAGMFSDNAALLRQLVLAEFTGLIESFSCGRMLSNGSMYLPEWVEFTLVGEPNRINVWLADESFQAQYDEYIIEIIHPLIPYANFFKDPLVVRDELARYSIVDKLQEVQDRRAQYPFTYQQAFQFDYVNPRDATIRTQATWIAIIYGEAGNNPDLIKDAIIKDLLTTPGHSREDWEAILPDLFLMTEFIFTPFWNQYSVPNADFRAGIYSPIFDPRRKLNLIRATAKGTGYTQVYVDNNYEESVNIYKSVAFAIVGNPKNRNGINKFSLQYPDYIVTENDSADAQRVSPLTLEWMMVFSRLLVAAEAMTEYTSVPRGIARMKRDGILYASAFFKNVNYMVVTKSSVEAIN